MKRCHELDAAHGLMLVWMTLAHLPRILIRAALYRWTMTFSPAACWQFTVPAVIFAALFFLAKISYNRGNLYSRHKFIVEPCSVAHP
jgi:hypothetical protein